MAVDPPVAVRPAPPARLLALGWVWSGLAMLAAGLVGLTAPVIWRDELASLSAARRPIGQLWRMLHHVDAVSGLYYLLLHAWIGLFGDSLVSIRLLSTLAMAAAAAFVSLTARRLYGHGAGLAAGLIFAVLPITTRYAQEARGYALCLAAAAAAGWLLLRAVAAPGWRRWLAYTGAAAVAGLAHLVALAMLAGHAAVVAGGWWRTRRRGLAGWPAAAVVVAAVTVPVLAVGDSQRGGQLWWLPPPGFRELREFWPALVASIAAAAALLVLAAIGALTRPRRAAAYCGATLLIPLAVVFAISRIHPVWYPRYLLFVLPGFVVLAAAGAMRLRPAGAIAAIVVVAAIGLPDQLAVRQPGAHSSGRYPFRASGAPIRYDLLGDRLAAHRRPGDVRLFLAHEASRYYETYLDARFGTAQPRLVCEAATGEQVGRLRPVASRDLPRCLGTPGRIWLIRTGDHRHHPLTGLPAPVRAALSRYHVTEAHDVGGATLILAVR